MVYDVGAADIVWRIPSPGFVMRPPALRHAERIPHAVRASMDPAWGRLWFAPRDITIAVLADVFVAGQGIVLTRGLSPVRQTMLGHGDAVIERAREAVAAALRAGALPRLRGDTVLCDKAGATVYGHFLAELLPRAWLACRHWDRPLRFLLHDVKAPLRDVMAAALARIGIGPALCTWTTGAPLLVDRLVLVDGLTEHGGYMSPLVADCLGGIAATIAPLGPARLLVLRNDAIGRGFADRDAIVARALAAGFAVIEPSSLGFPRQVARFRAARRVVGVMGSGLANIAFCAPGAAVDVLAPASMPDTFFWLLAGHAGLDHVEIRCQQAGPRRGNAAWDTDIVVDEADREATFGGERRAPAGSAALGRVLRDLFDEEGYRRRYPDVDAAGVDPLTHYCEHGWREGRDPSAAFDTGWYLRRHPDVAAAGINPLLHYVLYGEAEGREIKDAASTS